jgi:hypothetical protein
MNIRQQKYKKFRLEGYSAYQSALKAGYRKATAIAAHRNIEKRIDFTDVLIKAGIDDDSLGKLLQEGLAANKVVAADVLIKNENGKMVAVKNENDWIEYPDWIARHRFIETVLNLKGQIKTKVEHSGEIRGGATRIILVTGVKKDTSESNPQRLPAEIHL